MGHPLASPPRNPWSAGCWSVRGNPPPSSTSAKHLVDRCFRLGGAGGNRTPVHQPVNEPATTIPDPGLTLHHRRVGRPRRAGSALGLSRGSASFRPSAVFPAAIPRFCCRAAGERPRATFLLTMSLRSPEDQAARANCSSAILVGAPFSESEQLGSQARPASLTSKPVSPVG